jgi:hypothetical protein
LVLINGKRNRFESNAIPREVFVRTQGTPDFLASTIARNQSALSIQVDLFSTVTFENTSGRVFDPEEPGLATTTGTNNSTLTLTTAQIAKSSYVQTRNLQVLPNVGTAAVTILVWNVSGSLNKRWLTQASPTTRSITYKVGDLTPGVSYYVIRNGVGTKYNADAAGAISFSDASVNTAVTDFTVSLTGP